MSRILQQFQINLEYAAQIFADNNSGNSGWYPGNTYDITYGTLACMISDQRTMSKSQ